AIRGQAIVACDGGGFAEMLPREGQVAAVQSDHPERRVTPMFAIRVIGNRADQSAGARIVPTGRVSSFPKRVALLRPKESVAVDRFRFLDEVQQLSSDLLRRDDIARRSGAPGNPNQ